MKRQLLVLLLTIILPFLPISHANGFYEAGQSIVTPTAGMYFFDSTSNTENTPTIGARGDYCLMSGDAGNLCMEGVANVGVLKSKADSSTAFTSMLRVGPLFSLSAIGRWTPLLTASFGGMYVSSPGNSMPDKSAFATFGVGASYLLGERTALRADLSRLFVLDINGSNGFEMTVGFSYAFGGSRQKMPPVAPLPEEKVVVARRTSPPAGEAAPLPAKPEAAQAPRAAEPATARPEAAAPIAASPATSGEAAKLATSEPESAKPLAPKPETAGVEVTTRETPKQEAAGHEPEKHGTAAAAPPEIQAAGPAAAGPAVPQAAPPVAGEGKAGGKLPAQPPSFPAPAAGAEAPKAKAPAPPAVQEPLPDSEPSLRGLQNVKTFVTLRFRAGSAVIKPEYHALLRKVAALVGADPALRIRVAAHTDSTGNPRANYRLSLKRAQSVRKYLVRNFRIDPRRITARGYGHYLPVADNGTGKGRDDNRRVVVIVLER